MLALGNEHLGVGNLVGLVIAVYHIQAARLGGRALGQTVHQCGHAVTAQLVVGAGDVINGITARHVQPRQVVLDARQRGQRGAGLAGEVVEHRIVIGPNLGQIGTSREIEVVEGALVGHRERMQVVVAGNDGVDVGHPAEGAQVINPVVVAVDGSEGGAVFQVGNHADAVVIAIEASEAGASLHIQRQELIVIALQFLQL